MPKSFQQTPSATVRNLYLIFFPELFNFQFCLKVSPNMLDIDRYFLVLWVIQSRAKASYYKMCFGSLQWVGLRGTVLSFYGGPNSALWLNSRLREMGLSRSGLPALSRKQPYPESSVNMASIFICVFTDLNCMSVHKRGPSWSALTDDQKKKRTNTIGLRLVRIMISLFL